MPRRSRPRPRRRTSRSAIGDRLTISSRESRAGEEEEGSGGTGHHRLASLPRPAPLGVESPFDLSSGRSVDDGPDWPSGTARGAGTKSGLGLGSGLGAGLGLGARPTVDRTLDGVDQPSPFPLGACPVSVVVQPPEENPLLTRVKRHEEAVLDVDQERVRCVRGAGTKSGLGLGSGLGTARGAGSFDGMSWPRRGASACVGSSARPSTRRRGSAGRGAVASSPFPTYRAPIYIIVRYYRDGAPSPRRSHYRIRLLEDARLRHNRE